MPEWLRNELIDRVEMLQALDLLPALPRWRGPVTVIKGVDNVTPLHLQRNRIRREAHLPPLY